jgi:hypothetical protein
VPFFPEYLYQLSGRDEQVTWLDPLFNLQAGTGTTATVDTTDIVVPTGRALLLQAANVEATITGVEALQVLRIRLITPGTPFVFPLAIQFELAATGSDALNWSGSVIVPPGWSLDGFAQKSGAVSSILVQFTISGLLIPIGNIQRV